jgi:hypothetical protein
VTKTNEAIKQAVLLVSAYGDVVERFGGFLTFLYPVSALPASKEEIKSAIKLLLTSPTFRGEISNLKFGYSHLAQFIPDADARFAADVHRQSQQPRRVERGFSETYGRFVELSEAASAERDRLQADIEAYAPARTPPTEK